MAAVFCHSEKDLIGDAIIRNTVAPEEGVVNRGQEEKGLCNLMHPRSYVTAEDIFLYCETARCCGNVRKVLGQAASFVNKWHHHPLWVNFLDQNIKFFKSLSKREMHAGCQHVIY